MSNLRLMLRVVVVAALIVVTISLWVAREDQQSVPPVVEPSSSIPDPSAEGRPSGADDDIPSDESLVALVPEGFRRDLLDMPDDNRNQIFWLTIRDVGQECSEVKRSEPVGDEARAWRAHCGGALVYWVVADDTGNISVSQVPYGDIGLGTQPMRDMPETQLRQ